MNVDILKSSSGTNENVSYAISFSSDVSNGFRFPAYYQHSCLPVFLLPRLCSVSGQKIQLKTKPVIRIGSSQVNDYDLY